MYEVKQLKCPGHGGVAVIDDEVMVCERENRGMIMVYDRDLNYKRSIEHGKASLMGISTDIHDNIYVIDSDDMVHVSNKDGIFLRSFGCDSNGVKKLSGPVGICVSGQFVYVTNCKGYNVSVFTTAGDYVSSFGRHGEGDGEFVRPVSVCTDLDNFVYVVDILNNRVQCF